MTIRSMYTKLRNLQEESSKMALLVRKYSRQNYTRKQSCNRMSNAANKSQTQFQKRRVPLPLLSYPFVLVKSLTPSHNVKLVLQELARVEPLIRRSQKCLLGIRAKGCSRGLQRESSSHSASFQSSVDDTQTRSLSSMKKTKSTKTRNERCPILSEAQKLFDKRASEPSWMPEKPIQNEFTNQTQPWETYGHTPRLEQKCSCLGDKVLTRFYNQGVKSQQSIFVKVSNIL